MHSSGKQQDSSEILTWSLTGFCGTRLPWIWIPRLPNRYLEVNTIPPCCLQISKFIGVSVDAVLISKGSTPAIASCCLYTAGMPVSLNQHSPWTPYLFWDRGSDTVLNTSLANVTCCSTTPRCCKNFLVVLEPSGTLWVYSLYTITEQLPFCPTRQSDSAQGVAPTFRLPTWVSDTGRALTMDCCSLGWVYVIDHSSINLATRCRIKQEPLNQHPDPSVLPRISLYFFFGRVGRSQLKLDLEAREFQALQHVCAC